MVTLCPNCELAKFWVYLSSENVVIQGFAVYVGPYIKKKDKVHPCTGTEALYRLYGP